MSSTDETSDDEPHGREVSRREVLFAAAATAGVGATGYFSGRAAAQTASNDVGTEANPLLNVHTERFRMLGVTSTPTSPSGYATLHYRSDLD